jgi:GT2 family glycosyltransferase
MLELARDQVNGFDGRHPDVAAVVVHYRTPVQLEACLESLRAQRPAPAEVVVVDNSALVDGVGRRPARGEDWTWLRTPNIGYGAACNVGINATHSPLVAILNADVRLKPGALATLAGRLLAEDRAVAVGPRMWDASGSIELSARAEPRMHTALLGRSSALTRTLRRYGRTPSALAAAESSVPRRVDWVSGACQMLRRDAFIDVGGFDEGYWLYWEDADLGCRLRQAGGEVWFDPTAEVLHRAGSSGTTPGTVNAFHVSAARFYESHIARSRVDAGLVRAMLRARAAYVIRVEHGVR